MLEIQICFTENVYVCVCLQLKEVQQANGMATDPVTLASIARERRNASASAAASASTATEVIIPKVDFGHPRSFKPRSRESRRSRDLDDFTRPGVMASPAVNLPPPAVRLPSPVVRKQSPIVSLTSPTAQLQPPVDGLPSPAPPAPAT